MRLPLLLFSIITMVSMCLSMNVPNDVVFFGTCDSTGTGSNVPDMGWDSSSTMITKHTIEKRDSTTFKINGTISTCEEGIIIKQRRIYLKK